MNRLLYPTVDLFLYDLYDGFGRSPEAINQTRHRFWKRIYGHLSDQQFAALVADLQTAEKTFASYVDLLGTQKIEKFDDSLNGYYYPVKLGDTYALQIDCAGRKNDQNWEQLPLNQKLQETKRIVLEHRHIPGEMGEDWLVWGQLAASPVSQNPAEIDKEYEEVARELYESVPIDLDKVFQAPPKPNWQRDYKGKGSFKGAVLYELEQLDYTPDGLNQTYHVIVCLFPHYYSQNDIKKTIGQLYRGLFILLFHYRNKILWIYELSRQLKNTLKEAAQTIEKLVQSLAHYISNSKIDLKKLQIDLADALSISYYYETNLGRLQEHVSTIEINSHNYNNRVQEFAKLDPNADLAFLDRFGNFAEKNCLAQIKTDDQALSAGLKPLENFIRTIEGIIEIEKTKNDRTFNQTVAIASVGISTASLAASTISDKSKDIVQTFLPVPAKQPTPAVILWLSFSLAFLLSVAIGLLGAGVTWWALRKSGNT